MKFITILLLLILLATTFARRCPGRPRNPRCTGSRDVGRRGLGCTRSNMWYYDTNARECRNMRYRGCGGNNNRWCTKAECERSCRRP